MRLEVQTPAGSGVVELDRPRGELAAVLVLTHGATGRPDTVDVMAIRSAALKAGIAVARVTQPYRAAGRRAPDAPAKQDDAWTTIMSAIRRRRGFAGVPLVVGGRSNGARVACRTALATGSVGVLALAFPLHPPGHPEKTRIAELDGAGVPVLVVQGDRDPFGMPPPGDEREIIVIPGGDHSLKRDPVAVAVAAVAFVTTTITRARVPE